MCFRGRTGGHVACITHQRKVKLKHSVGLKVRARLYIEQRRRTGLIKAITWRETARGHRTLDMTRRSNVLAGDQYDYTQANEIELNTSVSPTKPLKVLLPPPPPPLATPVDRGQTREGGRGGQRKAGGEK